MSITTKRRRGRPTRAEASAAALAPLAVDPGSIDPRSILAAIAADLSAPAAARVAAAKALLAGRDGDNEQHHGDAGDPLTRRALELLAAGRPN